jgi:hypothetical protein
VVRTIKHDGDTGYLATITSHLENDFITNQIINGLNSPGNVNIHGSADTLDAIYLVAYLYRGGPEPICP